MKSALLMIVFCVLSAHAWSQDKDLLPAAAKAKTSDLHPSIAALYKGKHLKSCSAPEICGDIVMIDCHSATDGPKTYYNNTTGQVLMHCGGACLKPKKHQNPKECQACPPPEWICK